MDLKDKKGSALVIFGEESPHLYSSKYDVVLSGEELRKFVEPGSIYEATAMVEELSRLKMPDGKHITKYFTYKGYELWWMHENSIFLYFCLPYTQYRKLLEHLATYSKITLYNPPYKSLFIYFLQSCGCQIKIIGKAKLINFPSLPLGIFVQMLLTLLSLPVLIVKKSFILVFIGDKLEKGRDYDFRMKFVYEGLRSKNLDFVEFVRSLESWKKVLKNAFLRMRPVIYSEPVSYLGLILSFITGESNRTKKQFLSFVGSYQPPWEQFKFRISTHYLLTACGDIWSIKIIGKILTLIKVRAAFFSAAGERNMNTFLGCKTKSIETVGIMHGVHSRYYTMYDFMTGFRGEKQLSVDRYGLWSEWWREYYLQHSNAYRSEQLFVSGPMRPLGRLTKDSKSPSIDGPIKVLFISEQIAVPEEVITYLEALLNEVEIDTTIVFRPYRDGFRNWLDEHRPDILKHPKLTILEGGSGLQQAINQNEVTVGTMSTAVLEALFQCRVPIFFETKKWGDYYNLKGSQFFAHDTDGLIEKIKNARRVSLNDLINLQKKYFGDPHKNGSKWVVDQLEEAVLKGCMTR